MATRKESTGKRDLTFSGWVRQKLPDSSTGYMVTDIDFVFFNYRTKKMMICEIKTHNSSVKVWQKKFYEKLNTWIKKGIDDDWQYFGVNLITFEKTCFEDGDVFFNNKKVNEDELIHILSLI